MLLLKDQAEGAVESTQGVQREPGQGGSSPGKDARFHVSMKLNKMLPSGQETKRWDNATCTDPHAGQWCPVRP